MTKVLLEREGYRFVEKGIIELNGMPDYRLQKQNYYTKHWNDIYLFDNSMQLTTAMEDHQYARWLDPDRVPCYIKEDDILDWDQQSRDDLKLALVGSNPFSHGETLKVLVESQDPIMSLQSLSRIVGADGTLSRLVSNFQLKNWWRA